MTGQVNATLRLERDVLAYVQAISSGPWPQPHDVKYYAIQGTFADLLIEDAKATAAVLQFT